MLQNHHFVFSYFPQISASSQIVICVSNRETALPLHLCTNEINMILKLQRVRPSSRSAVGLVLGTMLSRGSAAGTRLWVPPGQCLRKRPEARNKLQLNVCSQQIRNMIGGKGKFSGCAVSLMFIWTAYGRPPMTSINRAIKSVSRTLK